MVFFSNEFGYVGIYIYDEFVKDVFEFVSVLVFYVLDVW